MAVILCCIARFRVIQHSSAALRTHTIVKIPLVECEELYLPFAYKEGFVIMMQSQETMGSVMTPRDLVWFLCRISGGLGMMSEFCVISNVGKTLWFCKRKKRL